ncbi:DUF5988 family protein [Actinomadura sp. 3N407]|uniref:DUF5988 family protein n=1 Tax=Actinomadura sp. 3N407 TaxID=3457423 RepID=UPI003FCD76DC
MSLNDTFMDAPRPDGCETVRVVLEGGPGGLPSELRLRRNDLAAKRVKIPCRGGYEHFELVDEARPGGDGSPVFRWTMRTKVAE